MLAGVDCGGKDFSPFFSHSLQRSAVLNVLMWRQQPGGGQQSQADPCDERLPAPASPPAPWHEDHVILEVVLLTQRCW